MDKFSKDKNSDLPKKPTDSSTLGSKTPDPAKTGAPGTTPLGATTKTPPTPPVTPDPLHSTKHQTTGVGASGTPTGSTLNTGNGKDEKEKLEQTAERTKEDLKQEANTLANQAKDAATTIADRKKDSLAHELDGISSALNQAATDFRTESGLPVDQYIRTAADSVSKFSNSIKTSNSAEMVRKLEDVTREHPVAVLGGAAFIGFLAARFMRASAEHQHYQPEQQGYRGATTPGQPNTGNLHTRSTYVDPSVSSH